MQCSEWQFRIMAVMRADDKDGVLEVGGTIGLMGLVLSPEAKPVSRRWVRELASALGLVFDIN